MALTQLESYMVGPTASTPKITSLAYSGVTIGANQVGGETLTITGSGFSAGATVYVDTTSCTTTFVNSTTLTFIGPVKSIGTYHLYVYNTDGSFAFKPIGITVIGYAPTSLEVLVVAGGGTGGLITMTRGTGGGAGGLIYIPSFIPAQGTYTVTVGGGGGSSSGSAVSNGSNSVLAGNGRTLTAIGGGSGGYNDNTNNGAVGGSGGGQWYPGYTGAASNQPVNTSDGISTYSTTGWGNKGGDSSSTQPYGSGGGGAGGAGGNFNGANGPVGGLGKSYSISGTSVTYAGGGSSGGYPGQGGTIVFDNTNYGGLGGGGTGYNNAYNVLSNGTTNTGGGGGSGGSGGSGIVIVRYADSFAAAASTTGSPTITTAGGYRIYKFTASGSITF